MYYLRIPEFAGAAERKNSNKSNGKLEILYHKFLPIDHLTLIGLANHLWFASTDWSRDQSRIKKPSIGLWVFRPIVSMLYYITFYINVFTGVANKK